MRKGRPQTGNSVEANWHEIKQRLESTGILTSSKNQRNPFLSALSIALDEDPRLSKKQLDVSTNLYHLLSDENRLMTDNINNNQLLASASIQAAKTESLSFWRFVCISQTTLTTEGSKFSRWTVEIDKPDYDDTLTPTLERDKDILDCVKALGVNTNLHFILNDYEIPLRKLKKNEPDFFDLSWNEQERGIKQLSEVREITTQWIIDTIKGQLPFKIKFISSMIGFKEFLSLMDLHKMIIDPKSGIVAAEQEFVAKLNKDTTLAERLLGALSRVAQYSAEGVVIPMHFPGAIFLDSERPVQSVWKKLTFLNPNIPTLFYVTDAFLYRKQVNITKNFPNNDHISR